MPRKRNTAPFASFGADMKEARNALKLSQRVLAEIIGIDPRYLANIENSGALPSLPIFFEIVSVCKLPVERYFYPEAETEKQSAERERTALKLQICPEKYLPVIEGAIDAAIKLDEAGND